MNIGNVSVAGTTTNLTTAGVKTDAGTDAVIFGNINIVEGGTFSYTGFAGTDSITFGTINASVPATNTCTLAIVNGADADITLPA